MTDSSKYRDSLKAHHGKSDGIHSSGNSHSGKNGVASSSSHANGGGAVYHFSVKAISRSSGRSVTAAIAYRSGEEITDERTGEVYDYTRKEGVEYTELILPGGGTENRAEFWNRVEQHHKRGDAVLAREVEVSLPSALSKEQRRDLAVTYARELADRYGVAADVAIHAPRTITDRELERNPDQYFEIDPDTGRRHNGNWHAHIVLSACKVAQNGDLGKKAVELDPIASKRAGKETMVQIERQRWADLQNGRLQAAGLDVRVDHRRLDVQGIDREPTQHLGPIASAIERRTGESSRKRIDYEAEAAERLSRAKKLGDLGQQSRALDRSIIDVSGDLAAAVQERDQVKTVARNELADLASSFKANFAATKTLEQAAQAFKEKQALEQKAERGRAAKITKEKEGPDKKADPSLDQGKAAEGQKKTALQILMEKRAKTPGKSRGMDID